MNIHDYTSTFHQIKPTVNVNKIRVQRNFIAFSSFHQSQPELNQMQDLNKIRVCRNKTAIQWITPLNKSCQSTVIIIQLFIIALRNVYTVY